MPSLSVSQQRALATTPAGFAHLASNGRYELADHVRYLNRQLVDVTTRRTKRLMVFCPPRHAKSTTISHYFPAWYLGTHPDHRIILSSYEADFAATWGRKARDVLTEWGPSLFGVSVSQASSAANRWDIEGRDGGMTTAGVGGPITGRGAHVLIIDDPIKNAEEALSATRREHIRDWWLSTAYTRLEPNGIIIITLTRWHEEDLAGWLLSEGKEEDDEPWTVVSLPAIAEEGRADVLGRQPGEALWPERYPVERLTQIKATLESSFWWAALYQQRPAPREGGIFRREWFNRRYRELPHLTQIVQSVDSAFKTGVSSDYSVIATWGTDGRDYYLLHLWRAKVAFPDLVRAITDQAATFHPSAILIEDAASGQSAIQQLKRDTNLPIIAVPAKGSKESRADSVSPVFEAGKVVLPESASYLGDFIEEHVNFPRGAHDDIVDTSGMAITRLRGSGGRVAIAVARDDMMDPVQREITLAAQGQFEDEDDDDGEDALDEGAADAEDETIPSPDADPDIVAARRRLERLAQQQRANRRGQRHERQAEQDAERAREAQRERDRANKQRMANVLHGLRRMGNDDYSGFGG